MYFVYTPSPPAPASATDKNKVVTWVVADEGATDVQLTEHPPDGVPTVEILSRTQEHGRTIFTLQAKTRGQSMLEATGKGAHPIARQLWIGYFMCLPIDGEVEEIYMAESQQTRDTPTKEGSRHALVWSPTGKCYLLNTNDTTLQIIDRNKTLYWTSGETKPLQEPDPLEPGDYGDMVYQLKNQMLKNVPRPDSGLVWSLAGTSWQRRTTPSDLWTVIQKMREMQAVVAWAPPELVEGMQAHERAPEDDNLSVTCYVLDTYQLQRVSGYDPKNLQKFPLHRFESEEDASEKKPERP